MVKKFFLFILTFWYLGVASGLTINIHYCMGKITGSALTIPVKEKDHTCNKCGMKASSSCCNDLQKLIKITDSHKASFAEYNIDAPAIVLLPNYDFSFVEAIETTSSLSPVANAPPESSSPSIHIYNCVFRL